MHCTVIEWPDGALTFELTGTPGWKVDYAIKPDVRLVLDPEPAVYDCHNYRFLYADLGGVTWHTNHTGYLQLNMFDEATA
jgi:hypothetical protein